MRSNISTGITEGVGGVTGCIVALCAIPGGQPVAAVIAAVTAAGFTIAVAVNVYNGYLIRIRLEEIYNAI